MANWKFWQRQAEEASPAPASEETPQASDKPTELSEDDLEDVAGGWSEWQPGWNDDSDGSW